MSPVDARCAMLMTIPLLQPQASAFPARYSGPSGRTSNSPRSDSECSVRPFTLSGYSVSVMRGCALLRACHFVSGTMSSLRKPGKALGRESRSAVSIETKTFLSGRSCEVPAHTIERLSRCGRTELFFEPDPRLMIPRTTLAKHSKLEPPEVPSPIIHLLEKRVSSPVLKGAAGICMRRGTFGSSRVACWMDHCVGGKRMYAP